MEFSEPTELLPWQQQTSQDDRRKMINALLQVMMALRNRYPQGRLLFLAQQYERVNFNRSQSREEYVESINHKMEDLRKLVRQQGQPMNPGGAINSPAMGNNSVSNPAMNNPGAMNNNAMNQWPVQNQMRSQVPNQIPGQIPGQMPGQMSRQIPGQYPPSMPSNVPNQMGSNQIDSKLGMPNQQMGLGGHLANQMPGNQMGNQIPGSQIPGNQLAGNQMPGSQMPAGGQIPRQMDGNQMGGNQIAGNQMGGNQMGANQMPGSMQGQMGNRIMPPNQMRQMPPNGANAAGNPGGPATTPVRIPVEDRERIIREIVPHGTKTPIPAQILSQFPGLPPGTSTWEDVVRLSRGSMLSQSVHNQIKEKYQRYVNEALQLRYSELRKSQSQQPQPSQTPQPQPNAASAAAVAQQQQQQQQQVAQARAHAQVQAQQAKAQAERRQAEVRYRQQMLMQQQQQQQQAQHQTQQEFSKRMETAKQQNPSADGLNSMNSIGNPMDPNNQGMLNDNTAANGVNNSNAVEPLKFNGRFIRDMTSHEIMQTWYHMGFPQERAEVRQMFLEVKAELPRIQSEAMAKAPVLTEADKSFVSEQLVAPVFTKMISRTDQLIILYYLYSNKNRAATLKLIRIKPMLNFWHNQLAEFGNYLTSPDQLQTLKNELNRYFLFVSRCTKSAADKQQQSGQQPTQLPGQPSNPIPTEPNTTPGGMPSQMQQPQSKVMNPMAMPHMQQRAQMGPMMQIPTMGPQMPPHTQPNQLTPGSANGGAGMMPQQAGPARQGFMPEGPMNVPGMGPMGGVGAGYGPGSGGGLRQPAPQTQQQPITQPPPQTQQQPQSQTPAAGFSMFADDSNPGMVKQASSMMTRPGNPAAAAGHPNARGMGGPMGPPPNQAAAQWQAQQAQAQAQAQGANIQPTQMRPNPRRPSMGQSVAGQFMPQRPAAQGAQIQGPQGLQGPQGPPGSQAAIPSGPRGQPQPQPQLQRTRTAQNPPQSVPLSQSQQPTPVPGNAPGTRSQTGTPLPNTRQGTPGSTGQPGQPGASQTPFVPEIVPVPKPRIENPAKLRQLAPSNPTKYFLSVLGAVLKVPPNDVSVYCDDNKESTETSQSPKKSQTPGSNSGSQASLQTPTPTPNSSIHEEPPKKMRKRGWSGSVAASELRLIFKDVDAIRGLTEPSQALPTPPQDQEAAKQQRQNQIKSEIDTETGSDSNEWDYMSLLNA